MSEQEHGRKGKEGNWEKRKQVFVTWLEVGEIWKMYTMLHVVMLHTVSPYCHNNV